jgi:hypothetical protein
VQVQEAYVSLYKDDFSFPVYAKLGKSFIDYGDYNVYRSLPSVTQYLTEVNGVGADLGFLWPLGGSSVYGNVTGFAAPRTDVVSQTAAVDHTAINSPRRYPANFSAKLGVQIADFGLGSLASDIATTVDVSYLHNVASLAYYNGAGNNDIGTEVNTNSDGAASRTAVVGALTKTDGKALGGMDAHAGFAVKSGTLEGSHFDINFATFLGKGFVGTSSTSGSPWALSVDTAYQVNYIPVVQSASLLLGGGVTHDAGYIDGGAATDGNGLVLPQWQLYAGLGTAITKNFGTQLVYQFNQKPQYSGTTSGITSDLKSSQVVMMRFSLDV